MKNHLNSGNCDKRQRQSGVLRPIQQPGSYWDSLSVLGQSLTSGSMNSHSGDSLSFDIYGRKSKTMIKSYGSAKIAIIIHHINDPWVMHF